MRHGRLLRMQCSGDSSQNFNQIFQFGFKTKKQKLDRGSSRSTMDAAPLVASTNWTGSEKNESKAVLSRWVALKLVKLPLSVLQHCGACGLATKGLQFFKLIVVQQTIKTHPRRIKVRSHTMSAILCYGSVKSGFRTHATHGSQIH